jgi:hypothetical protein
MVVTASGARRCQKSHMALYRKSAAPPGASRHRLLERDGLTGARHAFVVDTLGVVVGRERLVQARHTVLLRLAGLDAGKKPQRSASPAPAGPIENSANALARMIRSTMIAAPYPDFTLCGGGVRAAQHRRDRVGIWAPQIARGFRVVGNSVTFETQGKVLLAGAPSGVWRLTQLWKKSH